VWVNGAFSKFHNIRWQDPPQVRERDNARSRLERWVNDPRIDFDAVRDFEALAASLLRALGMEAKAARNAVSASADMKATRKRRRANASRRG
jgi:hypothetical protein